MERGYMTNKEIVTVNLAHIKQELQKQNRIISFYEALREVKTEAELATVKKE